jgi:hypothetical protein
MTQRKSDVLRDPSQAGIQKKGKSDDVPYSQTFGKEDDGESLRNEIIQEVRKNRDFKVGELVAEISSRGRHGASSVEVKLRSLEDEGVIEFAEPEISKSFSQYIVSPKSLWFVESIVIIGISLVLIFAPLGLLSIFSEPILYLRYFFGAVLVLFLPGYAVMQALYANKTQFDDLTRFALSFVMSLASVVLISLALGVVPGTQLLQTLPIAAAISIFTIILLIIAIKRKYDYYRIAHHFEAKD